MIFFGPCSGLIPWLSGNLGYTYEPRKGSIAPDYVMDNVMDLVNIAFKEPWLQKEVGVGCSGSCGGCRGVLMCAWGGGGEAVCERVCCGTGSAPVSGGGPRVAGTLRAIGGMCARLRDA